jgi:protein deglycase
MRVLVILYEGFTEYEYQIPVLALHFYSVPFDTVGLETTHITGMVGLMASLDLMLSEVDPAGYSALLLPGIDRSKRDQIAKNVSLLTLIRDFDRAQKLIAAVCAAPVFLGEAGILKGRQFCSEVKTHAAYERAFRVEEPAVQDGHIITGLGSRIFHFTALFLEALLGKESAEEYRQWAGICKSW